MIKLAINGFGRIGRMVFRVAVERGNIDVVAINDLMDTKTLAHLLKYDSAQGSFQGEVAFDDEHLIVNGKKIPVFKEKDPGNLPWAKLAVDVAVESTGFFTKCELASVHLKAGAKKVLISAPCGDAQFVMVKGVNEHEYNPDEHHVISNASCTTNCLAPIVKVLDDNYGIVRGYMTTIHAFTGDQRLQDAPHKDLRRARAASVNIVPTTTGAAKAVAQAIPHLKGKLDGIAVRVPVVTGSYTDFVCEVEKDVSAEQINELFKNVARHHLESVIEYTEEPLVSSDIVHNSHSCIFDAQLTHVIDGNFVKVLAWYDNEWGYSNRMIDVVEIIGK